MNIRHLRAALAVQDAGSMSAAAQRVHLSQSAVTQAVHALEQELACALFATSPAGATPTAAGERFLRRARRAMRHLQLMDKQVQRSGPGHASLATRCTRSQLAALVGVVEHRSYSRAAQALGLAQPSLHRSIKSFETGCGARLFDRQPGGVEPAWLARRLARCASLFFAELEQGKDELSELKAQNNSRLRVGALPLARTSIVPDALIRVLDRFPHSRISIVDGPYEEQLQQLLSARVDVIVGALRAPEPAPEIVQEFLFSDPLRVVTRAGHPLTLQPAPSAAELRRLKWIAPRAATPARAAFARFFESAQLDPPLDVIECSSLVAARGILLKSDRAALLPALQVAVDVQAGLLAIGPQPLPGTGRDIGLSYRSDWEPTAIQHCFLEALREAVRRTTLPEAAGSCGSGSGRPRVPSPSPGDWGGMVQ